MVRTRFWCREPASRKTAPFDPVLLSKLIYLRDICSTSHSNLNLGSRILMICCVSRAKMYFEHQKFEFSLSFAVFFSIFLFSQFWMVLRCSHSEFRLRGLISCPGLVSNRPDMKYQAYSNFRVHMVFMCRPCVIEISVAMHFLELAPC